jgi:hypothetical protein
MRPSGDVNMSSTNWSWPSPTSWRIPRKYPNAAGSAWISAIRSARSGTMSSRPMRVNASGSTTSAVPSQLLPTSSTSRVAAPAGTARLSVARHAATRPLRTIVLPPVRPNSGL